MAGDSSRKLVFMLDGDESWREEKRRFFSSQVERLNRSGIAAELNAGDRDEISSCAICIFDVAQHAQVMARIGDAEVHLVPIIWDPYRFFSDAQRWISEERRVSAVLTPQDRVTAMVKKYPLRRPFGSIQVAMDYDPVLVTSRERPSPLGTIGYLMERRPEIHFVRGVLARTDPSMAGIEWIELDFRNEVAWGQGLARCDAVLSLRDYAGSALPLLDCMMAGRPVCGTHGGGLLGHDVADAGFWCTGSTLEAAVVAMREMVTCFRQDPERLELVTDRARQLAGSLSAEATFPGNLQKWQALQQL